jgi:hypothetical protein
MLVASALFFITHVTPPRTRPAPDLPVIEATPPPVTPRMPRRRGLDADPSANPTAREIVTTTPLRISCLPINEIPRPFTRKEALHARRLAEQYTIYIALLRDMADPATNHNTRLALYEQRAAPLYRLIASDTDRLKSLAGERINQLLEDAQEASRRTLRL